MDHRHQFLRQKRHSPASSTLQQETHLTATSAHTPLPETETLQAHSNHPWSFGDIPLHRPDLDAPKPNTTGLPDNLKTGIENLSGLSLDDVHVHYNSAKPAKVQALAYTQGTEIHVGPSQEQHLAHEAWHVVQQKQGRVKPTRQVQGAAINDDQYLEQEADRMGSQAKKEINNTTQLKKNADQEKMDITQPPSSHYAHPAIQRVLEAKNPISDLEQYLLQHYNLEVKCSAANPQGYVTITSIQIKGTTGSADKDNAVQEFLKLVQPIISDAQTTAKINVAGKQGYGETQEIMNKFFKGMAQVDDKTAIYSLAAFGHEIYENYHAQKNNQNTPNWWAPDKTPGSGSGYPAAHEEALKQESQITAAGGLGRRLGQMRDKRGGVALLEEGIMLAFIPNTSSQPQAQWLPVQKVDVPITLLSPGTWNPNDLKTLDTMRNTAKELDLIVANSATKAKSAYFQVFAPANDPEGTNLLLLLQNKYNDPANGLTLVDPQLQTINAGYKVIVRHLP